MSTMSPFVSENDEALAWSSEQPLVDEDLDETGYDGEAESDVYGTEAPGEAMRTEGHHDFESDTAADWSRGREHTFGETFLTEPETYWELEAEDEKGEASASERAIVERQVAGGTRDVNKLSNLVFWARYPSLNGQRIPAGRKDLEREWIRIKNEIVVPLLASLPQGPAPTSTVERDFVLRYEGDPSKTRRVTRNDPEFRSDFIDNFVSAKANVNKIEGRILKLELEFRDGRRVVVEWQRIPIHYRGTVQTGFVDYFVKARDGFIYPVFAGRVSYNLRMTPNLVLARSDLEVRVRALRELSDLMFLAGKFASIIGAGGSAHGAVSGAISKSGATNVELLQP
jgi:hypothetical protein